MTPFQQVTICPLKTRTPRSSSCSRPSLHLTQPGFQWISNLDIFCCNLLLIYFSGPPCKSAQCDLNLWDPDVKLRRFFEDGSQLWERKPWCSVSDFVILSRILISLCFWWIKDINQYDLFLTDIIRVDLSQAGQFSHWCRFLTCVIYTLNALQPIGSLFRDLGLYLGTFFTIRVSKGSLFLWKVPIFPCFRLMYMR